MMVTPEAAAMSQFRLPPGFDEVWSRPQLGGAYIEMTIDGPFPPEVDDNGPVAAVVYQEGHAVEWQWCRVPDGQEVGERIVL